MSNEELKIARKKIFNISEEQEKLKKLKEEAIQLAEDPIVKRYLEIQNYLNIEILSEVQIIKNIFEDMACKTCESNKIMVFVGTYKQDKYLHDNNSFNNESNIETLYNSYIDLETQETYKVALDKVESFESKYKIIYIPNPNSDSHTYMDNYFKLKNYFFKELVNHSQEDVIERLQHENIINEIMEQTLDYKKY